MGDMSGVAPGGRLRAAISFWALAGIALLVSHDAIFAIQAGPGEALTDALRDSGHDYWGIASALIAAIALILGLLAVSRVRRLRQRAFDVGVRPVAATRASRIVGTWGRLLIVVSIGFLLQENVEHLAVHGHLIGLGALAGPEYPLAIPVIAAVTLAAGLVAALISGTEAALLEAIALALAALRPGAVSSPYPLDVGSPRRSVLARRGAGRAPPVMAFTT